MAADQQPAVLHTPSDVSKADALASSTRPIAFTIDNRYIKPLAVALRGLMDNSRSPRRVYVFHEGLHPLFRAMLRRWLRCSNIDLQIIKIRNHHRIRPIPHHFSRAILLRLLIASRIRESEFLYLDSDVIIRDDLSAIDAIRLDDALIMASPHPQEKCSSGRHPSPSSATSYASGLLVINRQRFTAERIGERCLELIRRSRFDYPDQEALNQICGSHHWKALPEGLNLEVADTEEAWTRLNTAGTATENEAVILQLAGSEKPWHLLNCHPYRREFQSLLRRTPFRLLPYSLSDTRWRSLASRGRRRLVETFGATNGGRGNRREH